jgi:colanic acid biosynthesis glycosyl transferase WcaI
MKILIVSQYFWPENFKINDLASELYLMGHEITVLTGYPNYPDGVVFSAFHANPKSFKKYNGVDVLRVPIITRGQNNVKLILNYISYVLSASFFGLWKLRKKDFDIIFVFEPSPITVGLPAILFKKIKNAKIIFWTLDLWPETLQVLGIIKSNLSIKFFASLTKFIYKRSDLILGQSKGFVQQIRKYCEDDGKIKYFPSWAESVYLDESAVFAPEIEYRKDLFNVVFAGNIGEAQDFPAILDAAEKLKYEKIRWIILGSGRLYEWVKDEIAKRGLETSVLLLGQFPINRMPSFYKHAQALLVTLKSDENLSLTIPGKLQSYLASGIPILGMLNGEGANVINEAQAGIVVPAGNGIYLSNSIKKMSKMSASKRSEMVLNAKNYVKNEFDRDKLIKLLESWMIEYSDNSIPNKLK